MSGAVGRMGGWAVGIAVAALIFETPNRLAAQTEGSILTALPGSTRSAALGGAGAALVGDAGAMFANPAGIATIRHLRIEGSYDPYLAGSAVSAAALALRVQRWTLGFGAQALDFGSEAEIVPDPATGGRRRVPPGAAVHPHQAAPTTALACRPAVGGVRGPGQ